MSYQTEEALPMLDGANTSKKQSFGLTAFMVLCLAVTSFMTGHAYSSAATASVSTTSNPLGLDLDKLCDMWVTFVGMDCDASVAKCATNKKSTSRREFVDCLPSGASMDCFENFDQAAAFCFP